MRLHLKHALILVFGLSLTVPGWSGAEEKKTAGFPPSTLILSYIGEAQGHPQQIMDEILKIGPLTQVKSELWMGQKSIRQIAYTMDKNGFTLNWQVQGGEEGYFIRAESVNDTVEVAYFLAGMTVKKLTMKLDQKPWIQDPQHGLEAFARSPQKTLRFWTFDSNNPEKSTNWKAVKKKEEIQVIAGKNVKAIRIDVAKDDWYSPGTRTKSWYRKRDGRFLGYEYSVRTMHGESRLVQEKRVKLK